jgi:hypothetical protein
MNNRTLSALALTTSLQLACGSDAGSPNGNRLDCDEIATCGGDLVGSWVMTDSCSATPPPVATTVDEQCPAARSVVELVAADDAFAAFNPDGTFTMGLTTSFHQTTTLPASCVDAVACAQIDASEAFTCEAVGASCVCESDSTFAQTYRGTFTTDRGLALAGPGLEALDGVGHCVRGDTLTLSWRDAAGDLQASRFKRGITTKAASFAAFHALNLAEERAIPVMVGDQSVVTSFAAASAPMALEAGIHDVTVDGVSASPLTRSAGSATSLVLRSKDGVLGTLPVARPSTAQGLGRDLQIVNATGAALKVWVQRRQASIVADWRLAADEEVLFESVSDDDDLLVDFDGDDVAEHRFSTAAPTDGFGVLTTLIVGKSASGVAVVIADDGKAYARAYNQPLVSELRLVHADPSVAGNVRFTYAGEGAILERYEASPAAITLPTGIIRVVAYDGDVVLAERDVQLDPDSDTLVALLWGPDGHVLRAYTEPFGRVMTLVNADRESEHMTFHSATTGGAREATLATDLQFGNSARADFDGTPPPLLLERDGVIDRDTAFFRTDRPIYDRVVVFALPDAKVLLVPTDDALLVAAEATSPVTVDVAHLASDLGPVTVEIGTDSLDATFGATPRMSGNAGVLDVVVSVGGAHLTTLEAVVFAAGEHYTVTIVGSAADPRVLLVDRRSTPAEPFDADVAFINGEPTVANLIVDTYEGVLGPLQFGSEAKALVHAGINAFKLSFDATPDVDVVVRTESSADDHRLFVFASIAREPVLYEITLAGEIRTYRGTDGSERVPVSVINATRVASVSLATLERGLDGIHPRPFATAARLALPVSRDGPAGVSKWRISAGATTLDVDIDINVDPAQLVVYERSVPGPNGEPIGSFAVDVLAESYNPRFLTYGAPAGTTFEPLVLFAHLDGPRSIVTPVGRDSSRVANLLAWGTHFGMRVDGDPIARWTWDIGFEKSYENSLMLLDASVDPPALVMLSYGEGMRTVTSESPLGFIRVVSLGRGVPSFWLDGVDRSDDPNLYEFGPANIKITPGRHTFALGDYDGELTVVRGGYYTLVPTGAGPTATWTAFDNVAATQGAAQAAFFENFSGAPLTLYKGSPSQWTMVAALGHGDYTITPSTDPTAFGVDTDGDGLVDYATYAEAFDVGNRIDYCAIDADLLVRCFGNSGHSLFQLEATP